MPKKKREPDKLREDVNEIAFRTVQAAIGEAEKPVAPSPSRRTDTRGEGRCGRGAWREGR